MTTSNIRFRTSSTLFYDKCSSSVAGIVLPGISRFSEAAKFNVLGCSLKIRTRALKTEIRNFHLLFYYCVTVFVMLCFPFAENQYAILPSGDLLLTKVSTEDKSIAFQCIGRSGKRSDTSVIISPKQT